jgi:hypothetical protein
MMAGFARDRWSCTAERAPDIAQAPAGADGRRDGKIVVADGDIEVLGEFVKIDELAVGDADHATAAKRPVSPLPRRR